MARPAISDAIRVRRMISELNDEDFADVVRDIDIIAEVREGEKKRRASKGVTSEQTTNANDESGNNKPAA